MFQFFSLVLVFYLWHAFGVTIGLHRLLSHRAFRCPKAVEYFWVLGAYLAFHGSPCWWATIHRAHHRHSDTVLDPHTPTISVMHSYWFFRDFAYPDHINPHVQSKDLLADPVYRALECGGNWRVGYAVNVVACILFRLALLLLCGPVVAGASLLAGVLALNMPLILNIICHIPRFGYRLYDTKDQSVNVWFMAVVGLGDGWHNNHHACPGSSRMGIKPWEIDLSFELLRVMQKMRLVSQINESLLAPAPSRETAPLPAAKR